jgi:hypothetical protein
MEAIPFAQKLLFWFAVEKGNRRLASLHLLGRRTGGRTLDIYNFLVSAELIP